MRRNLVLMLTLCIVQSAFCQKTKVIEGIDPKLINISFESSDAVPNALDKDAKIYRFEWGVGDKVSLMYPGQEGLHWDNILPLTNTTNGKVSHEITNLKSNTKYYYRLQIINDQGETWSMDTQTFTTK